MNHKKDKRTKNQLLLLFYSFVIAITVIAFSVDLGDYSKFKLWLIFVSGSLIVMAFVAYKVRNYRCGDCGSKISETKEWKNRDLTYFCKKCNVVWNTGITPANSSDFHGEDGA